MSKVRVKLDLDIGLDEEDTLLFVAHIFQAGTLNPGYRAEEMKREFPGIKNKFEVKYSSELLPDDYVVKVGEEVGNPCGEVIVPIDKPCALPLSEYMVWSWLPGCETGRGASYSFLTEAIEAVFELMRDERKKWTYDEGRVTCGRKYEIKQGDTVIMTDEQLRKSFNRLKG